MDSSLFSIQNLNINSHNISEEEFQKIIYDKLQKILINTFPDTPSKQHIRVHSSRWQFACPFCHDSASDSHKKRGNFIFEEGPFYNGFKCFNCGKFMSISNFFKKFDMNLPLSAVDYLIQHKPEEGKIYTPHEEYKNTIFNVDEISKYAIDLDKLISIFGLQKISREFTPEAYNYLLNRCQYKFQYFLYDVKSSSLVILNTIDNTKVISFQLRPLKSTWKGPKYITISLQKIHDKILKDNIQIPENIETLSMLFNLYNIDVNRAILVTEGPMDALLLPNCIATLGATKRINLGVPLWYVYDSDEAGNKHAIEKLKNGQQTFMWEKIKKDYLLPQRKKWDINDFIIWCKLNNKNIPKLWKPYFTNNKLDILEI